MGESAGKKTWQYAAMRAQGAGHWAMGAGLLKVIPLPGGPGVDYQRFRALGRRRACKQLNYQ